MTRRAAPSRVELERVAARRRRPLGPGEHPDESPQFPELEYVPTLVELSLQGLAVVTNREGTHYRPTPEGQALLNALMRRNAARLREDAALRERAVLWAIKGGR